MDKQIDILAYKIESFDSDYFRESLVSYSPNSILLIFNQKKIWFSYRPLNCKIRSRDFRFFRFSNPKLNYYIYPILFLIDHFRIFKLLLSICLRQRPKVLLVENTYVAAIIGIIRKCNIVKKMIYLPGDWLAGSKNVGMWNNIGNNMVFPFFDYWACRFSDVTLDCTEYIAEARSNFWKRKISKREIVYRPMLKTKVRSVNDNRKRIVFVGNVREDSGLELVIRILGTVRINLDISLKIIGAYNDKCAFLYKVAQECRVEKYVEFLGFAERYKFEELFSDCFCGINILTSEYSHTTKTFPAKVLDYLQYLLPVIVTNNVGIIVKDIQSQELGLVINPNEAELAEALIEIYTNWKKYIESITRYINSVKGLYAKDIFANIFLSK